MTIPSIPPSEIRAAAEVHHELGPDYRDAVIDSFLEKVGREIDARVDARLASYRNSPGAPVPPQGAQAPAEHHHAGRSANTFLAVASMALGIPLTAIVVGEPDGITALVFIWLAIAVINVAHAVRQRRTDTR